MSKSRYKMRNLELNLKKIYRLNFKKLIDIKPRQIFVNIIDVNMSIEYVSCMIKVKRVLNYDQINRKSSGSKDKDETCG